MSDEQTNQPTRNFVVLGIHEPGVSGTDGQVARVRMFIGDKAIDEDLVLPRLITVEEQLEAAANARIAELQTAVSGVESEIVANDGQPVINSEFIPPEGITAVEEKQNV